MKKILLTLFSTLLLAGCKAEQTAGAPAPHLLGHASAPVLVEEFSDPQCPACGQITPQVEKIISDNPEVAKLEYYHFPLPYHQYGFISAEATECAADQGKFFEFLDTLFANQSSLSEDFLKNTATSLKLDRTKFDACLQNHEHKAVVLADMAEGNNRKIPGTPSLFVNGQMIQWSDAETFAGYLKSLVKK